MNVITAGWDEQTKQDLLTMAENGSMVEAMKDEFELSSADLKRAIEEVRNEKALQPDKEVGARTSIGLRDALFDTMDALIKGDIMPAEAKAVASMADSICKTVKLEMDAEKMRESGVMPHSGPRALRLGNDKRE